MRTIVWCLHCLLIYPLCSVGGKSVATLRLTFLHRIFFTAVKDGLTERFATTPNQKDFSFSYFTITINNLPMSITCCGHLFTVRTASCRLLLFSRMDYRLRKRDPKTQNLFCLPAALLHSPRHGEIGSSCWSLPSYPLLHWSWDQLEGARRIRKPSPHLMDRKREGKGERVKWRKGEEEREKEKETERGRSELLRHLVDWLSMCVWCRVWYQHISSSE